MNVSKSEYDVVVIGAGHNGLTNAAFLAKAGLRVLVVEKNDWIGGAAVSRELEPGWIYSNCSYVCSLLRPEIFQALELDREGLQITPYGGSATFLQNGDVFGSYWNKDKAYQERARHSAHDADAYERYRAATARQCRLVRQFLLRTPPDPASWKWRDLKEMKFVADRFAELGSAGIYDAWRFFTMSIADYLDQYFESDTMKAVLAGSGIIGTGLGPMSPGTAYVLLHHYMGDVDGNLGAWGFARGGMGAVSQALAGAVQRYGGVIEKNAEVVAVHSRDRVATGIELSNGRQIRAKTIVSNVDLKRTFLQFVRERDLPPTFVERVRHFRLRGSSGKLNIALNRLPEFPALGAGHELMSGDLHVVDSIERLERAYDDWKHGRYSADPYLDILIPTLTDPTMAPPGKHYMSVFVQYCPAKLATGEWTAQDKQQFTKTVLGQLENYAPNLSDCIEHIEVRTPVELEAEVGLTEGNIFQGELTLDQLMFNRPIPGYAQYRTPIKGLYLCGSTAHPGGGVMAAPGANAAREILRDKKQPNNVPEAFDDD